MTEAPGAREAGSPAVDEPAPGARRVTVALLGLAAGLRLLRAAARWEETAWLYAAYNGPTADALREGRYEDAFIGFVGLHPPLFPVLHALQELLLPAPALWLLFSAAASFGAVALLVRRHRLAALMVATSPLQLAYAAEVNNYPLLALAVVAVLWARERVAEGRPWGELAAVGVLAAWTHGLGGWVAGLAALTLGPAVAGRVLAVMALGCAPLTPGVWALAHEPHTYGQPPIASGLIATDWVARFGLLGLPWLVAAVLGVRRAPALAFIAAGTAVFIAALHGLGVTAPHQFPYLLALTAPLALLAEAGARSRLSRGLLVGMALLQSAWVAGFNGMRLRAVADPAPSAVDLALARARPGEAVYLLRPAPVNDDDKRGVSPQLWRLRPWRPMPMARPYPFAYDDHRHGQPRRVGDLTVYVNEHLWPELDQAIAAHPRLHLAVYGDVRFDAALEAEYGPPERAGEERLWTLEAR
ncbi:MAG: hypothetical protein H6739_24600 [Alphaproteobacteria bacterium]|nr:hypothetical protein [Alphaproteobacteria bacterium]